MLLHSLKHHDLNSVNMATVWTFSVNFHYLQKLKISMIEDLQILTTNLYNLCCYDTISCQSWIIQIIRDATVCSLTYFIAKSLYMFWVSTALKSGVLRTVTAASGTGNNTGTPTSLQHGQVRSRPGHVGGK